MSPHLLLLFLLLQTVTAQQSCLTLLRTQAEASLTHIPPSRLTHLFPHSGSLTTALTKLETTAPHCTPTQSLHVELPPQVKALLNNPSLPAVNTVAIARACRVLRAGRASPVYLLDGLELELDAGAERAPAPPAPFLGLDVLPGVVVELVVRLSCAGEPVERVPLGGVEVRRLREIAGRAFLVGRIGA